MSRLHPYKVEREDIPEYPLFSIHELIINAVCHRDYHQYGKDILIRMFDDWFVFYNIGSLPEWITPRT